MRYEIDYSFGKNGLYGETYTKYFTSWCKMEQFIGILQEIEMGDLDVSYYAYDRKKCCCLAES